MVVCLDIWPCDGLVTCPVYNYVSSRPCKGIQVDNAWIDVSDSFLLHLNLCVKLEMKRCTVGKSVLRRSSNT